MWASRPARRGRYVRRRPAVGRERCLQHAVRSINIEFGHEKNKYWWLETFIKNIERDTDPAAIRRAVSQVVEAPLREMSHTSAALAADRGQRVDVDALLERIESAIEWVTVKLDVENEPA